MLICQNLVAEVLHKLFYAMFDCTEKGVKLNEADLDEGLKQAN